MHNFAEKSNPPPSAEYVADLQRQLQKFSTAIAEFEAMAAELKMKTPDARVADMIRLNRDTINSMRRSAELVEERLGQAERLIRQSNSTAPFPAGGADGKTP